MGDWPAGPGDVLCQRTSAAATVLHEDTNSMAWLNINKDVTSLSSGRRLELRWHYLAR